MKKLNVFLVVMGFCLSASVEARQSVFDAAMFNESKKCEKAKGAKGDEVCVIKHEGSAFMSDSESGKIYVAGVGKKMLIQPLYKCFLIVLDDDSRVLISPGPKAYDFDMDSFKGETEKLAKFLCE